MKTQSNTLIEQGKVRQAVEAAFNEGAQTVYIGTDGGDGHVYRSTALAVFRKRDGVIVCVRKCYGLEWHDINEAASDAHYKLPGYGEWWIDSK